MTAPADGFANWQPIETAPKDGTRILALMGDRVEIANFANEKYHVAPRPYWKTTGYLGVRWDRDHQPVFWMPLPPPPSFTPPGERAESK